MIYIDSKGLAITDGAWDDGSVTYNQTQYPNYQYSDFQDGYPDPTPDDRVAP